jgi:hypothetical protein
MSKGSKITKEGASADFSKATWIKSTKSGPFTDNCVEVAFAGGLIGVRDSKDKEGPKLVFTKSEWRAFLAGVKDKEFELREPEED